MKLGKFFPSPLFGRMGAPLPSIACWMSGVLPAGNKAAAASAIYAVYATEKSCCFSTKTNGSSNPFPNEKIRLEYRIFFIGSINFFYPIL